MPFKSQAQRAYLYANEPDVAKKFAAETSKGQDLPKKLTKERNPLRSYAEKEK